MRPPVLGTNDVAELLGGITDWSPITVNAYSLNGKFLPPAGKLNGQTKFWYRSDVEAWVHDRETT